MDTSSRPQRRRKKKNKQRAEKAPAKEPILIAARRPGSPRLEKPTRRMKAASGRPRGAAFHAETTAPEDAAEESTAALPPAATASPSSTGAAADAAAVRPRREARIVVARKDELDDREQERRRLFGHFMAADGRSAISRAAEQYLAAGFQFPREQEAQLQLLEHVNEARAREAIAILEELLKENDPRKLPVFRQRLRRLEDYADEAETRTAAARLRRLLPS